MALPSEALILNSFGSDNPVWRYSIGCLLFSESRWWTQTSSPVTIQCRNTSPQNNQQFPFKFWLCQHLSHQSIFVAPTWYKLFWNPRGLMMWPTLSSEASSLSVMSFCLIRRFPRIISLTCFWWESSVAVTGLPHHGLSYKRSSPTCSCLNCHVQRVTKLTSKHLSPYTAWTLQWMWMGGIFSSAKNSITARYLNSTFSQPCTSTGTEKQLWIAVSSRLRMVRGWYPLSAWNRFYPVFFIPIKIMTENAKLFQTVRI